MKKEKKFFAKLNSNNCLVIYPYKKKGHCLFIIDLKKFKVYELDLLFKFILPIIEIEFLDYTNLRKYSIMRGLGISKVML